VTISLSSIAGTKVLQLLIGFAFWKTFCDLKSVNLLIINSVAMRSGKLSMGNDF
jgi:hypothetical protein